MQKTRQRLKPPELPPMSDWALKEFYLGSDSAKPGAFTFDAAEYQRGIFDTLSNPEVTKVVIKAASQTCKSQTALVALAYWMVEDPGPMLVLNATHELSQFFSKNRFMRMFTDLPILRGTIGSNKARDGDNTVNYKQVGASTIRFGAASSPVSVSAQAARYAIYDEASREVRNPEGTPLELMEKRQTTFHNRKCLVVSSPAEKGSCVISKEYEKSDKRVYMVPCPYCDESQILKWANVKWATAALDEEPTAQYECPFCNNKWSELEKNDAVKKGYWLATAPENHTVGFWISGLYSSFVTLSELATEFLASKDDPETLKTFVNTRLAEEFENASFSVADIDLHSRLEDYTPDCMPNAGVVLTCGVDVQIDRLECSTWLWGRGDESWLIEHIILNGDPDQPDVWLGLDDLLKKQYKRADGALLRIHTCCVDSGGANTDAVYAYTKNKHRRRVYAIKGKEGNRSIFPPKKSKSTRAVMYMVGVDTAKMSLYNSLLVKQPGAKYVHFPDLIQDQPDYFDQLTREKYRRKFVRGKPTIQWYVPDSGPVEAIDCRAYAHAAKFSIPASYDRLEKVLLRKNQTIIENKNAINEFAAAEKITITAAEEKIKIKKKQPKRRKAWGERFR